MEVKPLWGLGWGAAGGVRRWSDRGPVGGSFRPASARSHDTGRANGHASWQSGACRVGGLETVGTTVLDDDLILPGHPVGTLHQVGHVGVGAVAQPATHRSVP